jgi:hypothetical protein
MTSQTGPKSTDENRRYMKNCLGIDVSSWTPEEHNIPTTPADVVFEGGSLDEYATHVYDDSTKTAYIYPRDWIDLLPRAFNNILPPENASKTGLWTPRHDETNNMFLTAEKTKFFSRRI